MVENLSNDLNRHLFCEKTNSLEKDIKNQDFITARRKLKRMLEIVEDTINEAKEPARRITFYCRTNGGRNGDCYVAINEKNG